MGRRKITVLINGNHSDLYLSENISGVTSESTLTVESVTVFWDYNNVIKNVNDTITFNGNIFRFFEGYWTFDMLTRIRDSYVVHNETTKSNMVLSGLYIARNASDGCTVYSDYGLNLGNLAPLLGDGPPSTILYDELRTTNSEKTNKINGAKYNGKKILILKNDGKMEYSKSKINEPYVNEFKELLKKANKEHQKTPAALVEEHTGVDVTQDTMNSINGNVSERIESEVDDEVGDFATNPEITNNELREIRGILNVKGLTGEEKIKFLEVNRKYWKDKANDEKAKGNEMKSKLYDTITRINDLRIDEIRLRLNQRPESEEVIKMVEEEADVSDLTRFEKFKKWARENLLELSAVSEDRRTTAR